MMNMLAVMERAQLTLIPESQCIEIGFPEYHNYITLPKIHLS